jgi:SET domain-containing protein
MTQAIVFGLGSMFNHSNLHQNVGWERDLTNLLITYTTLREIKAGEELCISYGSRLTFKDTEAELEKDLDDWTALQNIIDLID